MKILKILNVMEHCETSGDSALLISFDFKKAFDKVEWQALRHILNKMGFGKPFCDMIHMMYNETYSCTMNNGHWSEFFSLSRGNRQGCPLSPVLLLTLAEAIGCKIRAKIEIKGINLEGYTALTFQFADYLAVCMHPSQDAMDALMNLMEGFTAFCGLNINFEKTAVMKLGPIRKTEARYYTLKLLHWSDSPIIILGIWLHPEWKIILEHNYGATLNKAKKIIDSWLFRNQSLAGKVTVVNSLISSMLIYRLLITPLPIYRFLQ